MRASPAEAFTPSTFLSPSASEERKELITKCSSPTLEDPESAILCSVRNSRDGWFCRLKSPLSFLLVCFYNIYIVAFFFQFTKLEHVHGRESETVQKNILKSSPSDFTSLIFK